MIGEKRTKVGVAMGISEWGFRFSRFTKRGPGVIATSAIAFFACAAVAEAQSASVTDNSPTAVADGNIPRTSWGKPDLTGTWTNSSLTELERESRYGTRLEMTPEELRQAEGDREEWKAFERKPSDLSDPNGGCDIKGVGNSVVCGYNSFWTDPGDTVMRVGGKPRTSFITSTPDGTLPNTIAGVQISRITNGQEEKTVVQRDGGARGGRPPVQPLPGAGPADDPEIRSVSDRCLLSFGFSAGPVMLPQRYNSTYFFVQTEDVLAIEVEMVHDVRQIRIGGKHRSDGIRRWMGDSIGWWEGDTLVAETINYHPYETFFGSSVNLKVTERFTRVAPDRILYQFQVDDPTVWAKPWGGEYEFGPSRGPLYEYACHEGNYSMQHILAGARVDDAAGAKTAASDGSE
ncbi:MAG TPA: hypothetical protein PLN33_02435 [Hyphomonadaceae bacterium]|nr:hypothetical protein [Hyphomonadaceae bacterium]